MNVDPSVIVNLLKERISKIEVVGHRKSLVVEVRIYTPSFDKYQEVMKAVSSLVSLTQGDTSKLGEIIKTAENLTEAVKQNKG